MGTVFSRISEYKLVEEAGFLLGWNTSNEKVIK